ncbi:MAG: rod shape-determining protein MreC [Prevotellaceae bacterium]|nr:rod shape-determining protein MreC [Prevotella sp.]MCI7787825.1 rod shape-determining protein MreC [Prevotella sp.]MDD5877517.1 rod shape-determining protein MreC [Prevotellaceae bacterium]MDD7421475.1 rod shape-determining protein MreC [Prevotellaceae bacterium]
MRNLLDFLARHNHWFLFVLLEVVSFVLLFKYNSYQGSVWFSSANAVAGKVYDASSAVDQYFSLVDVNRKLTERNVYLERELARLTDTATVAAKDSTYMQRMQAGVLRKYKSVPARVVSNSLDKLNNFITIDKGTADGVGKDMGVACGLGVVGIVYLTAEHYSVVIPVLNSKSNISCSIRGRGYFGYLHWYGDRPDEAYLDDVPRHARFRIGDIVVTSGYSSVFPPGMLVGKIMRVYNSANGMSYRLRVKLSTDFGNLRDVCVINDSEMMEQMKLLEAANDSLRPK